MDHTPAIIAFAGSLRTDSLNKKLVRIAAAAAERAGAKVTLVDLREHPMPLYDGDIEAEQGLPQEARRFKQLLIEHDGFLIASPEYNSGISGALKNAIDWASRPEEGETPLVAFKGKFAGLMAASPGGLGGLRGLSDLRSILFNIGVHVLPDFVGVAKAHELIDASGALTDEKQKAAIESVGTRLAETIAKMKT